MISIILIQSWEVLGGSNNQQTSMSVSTEVESEVAQRHKNEGGDHYLFPRTLTFAGHHLLRGIQTQF